MASLVLSVSKFNTDRLLDEFPECRDKVAHVPNGADDLFFEPPTDRERQAVRTDLGLAPEMPYLLSVANFQARKNLAKLLGAAGRLPEVRDGSLAVVLVGDGSDSEAESLRTAAAKIGPKAIVKTPGYRQGRSLAAIYSEAAALVFPSLCESFGIPAVEAMARGCPVALANSTALPEVAGDAGWYFDPESEEAIAQTLRNLLDRPEERRWRAETGREIAANYRWTAATDRLVETFKEHRGNGPAITGSPGRPPTPGGSPSPDPRPPGSPGHSATG